MRQGSGMGEASDITGATQDNRAPFGEDFMAGRIDTLVKTQAFFARLADSVRPGYVGDQHKNFVRDLLLQAETAGLYSPNGAP